MSDFDLELIQRFRSGETEAFERLVKRWSHRILNVAFRLLGDLEEARDIRQEACLRLYRALDGYSGRASFSTWLHQIVLNLCRDQIRRRQSRRRALEQIDSRPDFSSDPQETERAEQWRRVAAALRELPDSEREVVVLRHYQGLRFIEIAEILETPITTIQSRLQRAFGRLRAHLETIDQ
ncbi:MAG: sigma-70 family RNA polymerase sigma factor [Planctomycetota bacterium]